MRVLTLEETEQVDGANGLIWATVASAVGAFGVWASRTFMDAYSLYGAQSVCISGGQASVTLSNGQTFTCEA